MATLIKANNEVTQVKPTTPPFFTLQELQTFVGGYIEIIRLPNDRIMYVNEDGKMKRLPRNPLATLETVTLVAPHDEIVGDVIILERSEYKTDDDESEGA